MDPLALLFLGLIVLGLVGLTQVRPILALAYFCGSFLLFTFLAVATALGGMSDAEFALFPLLLTALPALLGLRAIVTSIRRRRRPWKGESPGSEPHDL